MAEATKRIGQNVCYVVAVVMIENNKILMVQEAKKSCHGKWYLPAGRVEHGETFDAAARREALEESGLVIEMDGLTFVEFQGSSWIRLTFTGRTTGGTLKDQPDLESLKAEWLDLEMVLAGGSREYPLRSFDIAANIEATKEFVERIPLSLFFIPLHVPHRHTEVSLLITRNITNGRREFLVNSDINTIPNHIVNFRSIFVSLRDMYNNIFPGRPELTSDQVAVVEVEFSSQAKSRGAATDGCRIIFSVCLSGDIFDLQSDSPYRWTSIDEMTQKNSAAIWCLRIEAPGKCVPVHFL